MQRLDEPPIRAVSIRDSLSEMKDPAKKYFFSKSTITMNIIYLSRSEMGNKDPFWVFVYKKDYRFLEVLPVAHS